MSQSAKQVESGDLTVTSVAAARGAGANLERNWCFVVEQVVRAVRPTRLRFHTETFYEALRVVQQATPGWTTETICLVSPARESGWPCETEVLAAYRVSGGYVCQLASGLAVYDPTHDLDAGVVCSLALGVRVYESSQGVSQQLAGQ